MTSNKPYLIRAIYEWIVDNGLTPHLVVQADDERVRVPREHVEDGKIVLNVAPRSVKGLDIGNETTRFGARFGGRHFDCEFPTARVLAIYARENGRGLALPEDDDEGPPGGEGPGEGGGSRGPGRKGGHLKVVK